MSYILDALKKAEQRRQRSARVPTLATLHRAPPVAGRRIWLWVAAPLILVVAAGALAWLFRPTHTAMISTTSPAGSRSTIPAAAPTTPPPGPGRPPEPTTPVAPAGREAVVALPPKRPPSVQEPAPPARAAAEPKPSAKADGAKPAAADPTLPAANTAPAQPKSAPADTSAPTPPAAPVGRPAATASPAPAAAVPAPPQRPVAPAEPAPSAPVSRPPERATSPAAAAPGVPPGIQEVVGKMRLQMVVYSEVPAQRLIFIDNQKYVEGSSIDGKLVVETITPEGAVLNYEGQRFQLHQ